MVILGKVRIDILLPLRESTGIGKKFSHVTADLCSGIPDTKSINSDRLWWRPIIAESNPMSDLHRSISERVVVTGPGICILPPHSFPRTQEYP